MTALQMSGAKGARLANSDLVPHVACPATLSERASTCRCRAVIASVGGRRGCSIPCYDVMATVLPCPRLVSSPTGGVWV
ncbi:hypothetical protein LIER_05930 [Lithospermum erythrorhizon]|uniref:Uncharacterized protein n=1 Tax=Lithospermum erythrorhizon TaxID=34254 RepID=A0AAV3P722_LITER